MTPAERAERRAEREAKAKAERQAYIDRLVAEAPPFTRADLDMLSAVFGRTPMRRAS